MSLSKPSILFWGTPPIASETLTAIYQADFSVQGVVSKTDQPRGRGMKLLPSAVKQTALELGFPVFTPEKIQDDAFITEISKQPVDFFVVIAFGKILPRRILELPKKACLNIHYSLLPKWRGASPIHFPLLYGEKQTGVSTILMNEKMDEGDILDQRVCEIFPQDNISDLTNKLCSLGIESIVHVLKNFDSLKPISQNNAEASYSKIFTKKDFMVDWKQKTQSIWNQFRAFSPSPGLKTTSQNQFYKILEMNPVSGDVPIQTKTGEMFLFQKKLFVKTGDGWLEILSIQPAGRKKMTASEFINGNLIQPEQPIVFDLF